MKSNILTFCLSLLLFSCNGPETSIYLGRQVPKKYVKEIRELGLLKDDEKIKYFYSTGLSDIKEGLYFITDQNLSMYVSEWEEPKTIIPFDSILKVEVEFNESFFDDTFVEIQTAEVVIEFPLSSEKKRDLDFYNYLLEKTNL